MGFSWSLERRKGRAAKKKRWPWGKREGPLYSGRSRKYSRAERAESSCDEVSKLGVLCGICTLYFSVGKKGWHALPLASNNSRDGTKINLDKKEKKIHAFVEVTHINPPLSYNAFMTCGIRIPNMEGYRGSKHISPTPSGGQAWIQIYY